MTERLAIDRGWKFHLGHASDMAKDFEYGGGDPASNTKTGDAVGAVSVDFDDREWRSVELPHDWAVELDFDEKADPYHGYKPLGRQFPETSIGWYRTELIIPREDEGRRLFLEFDGIFRDSIIWLNGHYLGRHLSGYTSFRFDITDYTDYGKRNVVVVRVDASHFEGWFYEGAGIYRHAWLVKSDPLHISPGGIFVRSDVKDVAGKQDAEIAVQAKIVNENDDNTGCEIEFTVLDDSGSIVAEASSKEVKVPAWETCTVTDTIEINSPKLWSVEEPNLYRLVTKIKSGSRVVDTIKLNFGVRTIRFDVQNGFTLNSKSFKLKGVCCHQDAAGVGSAEPDRMWEYRIKKLQEMGCNAYRCAHNPPAPELLDACDRMGMLVMDETRIMGSSQEAMDQLESLILRDRNHPSIIIWALGNEEHFIQGSDIGARIITSMKRLVRRLDPTRPVTTAMNGDWGSAFSLINDVQGCNYIACGDVDKFHADNPEQPVVASETASSFATRGIYQEQEKRGYTAAYGTTVPEWGTTAEKMWKYWDSRPFVAGVFVWTGLDYRGEALPYNWPCVNSNFGIMDICGFPKDNYYYYQSWWTNKTVLHIFPHWNWEAKKGEVIDVQCFSNCDEVELFLNGESLGKQRMQHNSHLAWKVTYEPGLLQAKGYHGGREAAITKVETTGKAAKIKLNPNRLNIQADGRDVVQVDIAILDDQERLVPTADNKINLRVSGKARIIGVGNGDPSAHDPEKSDTCRAFNGLCQVIIQSAQESGDSVLTVEAPGLDAASVTIYM